MVTAFSIGFTAQLFNAFDLGMDPQAKIGAVGQARHRHDWRAAERCRDHRSGAGDAGVQVAADQRGNHNRTGGDKNQARVDAVLVEGADILSHPQSRRGRPDGRKAEGDPGLFGAIAVTGEEYKNEENERDGLEEICLMLH